MELVCSAWAMVGLERREAAIVAEEVRNVWRLMFIWRGAHDDDDDDDDVSCFEISVSSSWYSIIVVDDTVVLLVIFCLHRFPLLLLSRTEKKIIFSPDFVHEIQVKSGS